MEVPLPNFQTLEERIKLLSEEISKIRSKHQLHENGPVLISEESKELIIQKIEHLLKLLDEF